MFASHRDIVIGAFHWSSTEAYGEGKIVYGKPRFVTGKEGKDSSY